MSCVREDYTKKQLINNICRKCLIIRQKLVILQAQTKRKNKLKNTDMKSGIHPENYRPVAFKDMSNGDTFISRSTVNTKETIDIDGVYSRSGVGEVFQPHSIETAVGDDL